MPVKKVRLSQEYCDQYRNQESIENLNGDWAVLDTWTEKGSVWVRIQRSDQIRSIPEKYVIYR